MVQAYGHQAEASFPVLGPPWKAGKRRILKAIAAFQALVTPTVFGQK
jgi:hypothetical protein